MCKNKYHYNDSTAADGRIKRTRVDERKTKERRKNDVEKDVENGVNEGKKLCPIFGTLYHFRYIKSSIVPPPKSYYLVEFWRFYRIGAAEVICDSFLSL